MGEQRPMTETMAISAVKTQFSSLVNRVYRRETRVVVEKSGIPVAALVSPDDLRRLDRLDRERAARFQAIADLRAAFADVPPEEIDREADRAVARLRGRDEAQHHGEEPAADARRPA